MSSVKGCTKRTWTEDVRKAVVDKRRSTGVKSFGFRVGRIRASFRKVKQDGVVFAAMACLLELGDVGTERMEN
jgi:hypothetical protein